MNKAKLVAGVDSSTQSVEVVVRDAQTGELIRHGRRSHPDGTEIDPEIWKEALFGALTEAGALKEVAAISIAGQQHGMVALDSDGNVIRDALLWNDTRSAQAAKDLNAELGGNTETAMKGGKDFRNLFTDRSDASGTGYFDPSSSQYRDEIFALALGREENFALPRIVAPNEFGGISTAGIPIAAGAGDNAAAALGIQAQLGDVVVSLGTSGTAFAVSQSPTNDPSGEVAGFADASGRFLPLVCTLNAALILEAASRILGIGHDEVGEVALTSPPGANGLALLPYFEGERTPNRPNARGVFSGMNLANSNRADIADGAARQAAWALLGGESPPIWNLGEVARINAQATPEVVERYRVLRDRTSSW